MRPDKVAGRARGSLAWVAGSGAAEDSEARVEKLQLLYVAAMDFPAVLEGVRSHLVGRARVADLAYQLLVALAVEDHDGEVVDVAVEGKRDAAQVRGHRPGEVDLALRGRSDDELLHVRIRRLEQPAALRQGDDGYGVVDHARRDAGAFDGVDGDVDVPRVVASAPELLTDEQHRRLVSFTFADDDLAVDL